jgi:hypothetical protein
MGVTLVSNPRQNHDSAESMLKASARGVEVERLPRQAPLAFGHNAINPAGLGEELPQDAKHMFLFIY